MNKKAFSTAILGFVLACASHTTPSRAAVSTILGTFVSATGSDSNACTIAAPCRTLQGAYNATAPGGTINALDPGGYGPITITHAISIVGHGWASASGPANGTIITISAGPSDAVRLDGLRVEGSGVGLRGIDFQTGGFLQVINCVVHGFKDGIVLEPSAGTGAASVVFTNVELSANSHLGMNVSPINGVFQATFERLSVVHNNAFNTGIGGVVFAISPNNNSVARVWNSAFAENFNDVIVNSGDVELDNVKWRGTIVLNNGAQSGVRFGSSTGGSVLCNTSTSVIGTFGDNNISGADFTGCSTITVIPKR